jgi:hypothetical protein
MDEHHIIANLMTAAIDIMERPQRQALDDPTALFALLQRQNTFIGRFSLSPGLRKRFILHIQVSFHTAWKGLRTSGSAVGSPGYPAHFRLLCLANRGETLRPHWKSCTEAVAGQYNVDLESLDAPFKPRIIGDHRNRDYRPQLFPNFVRTQDHFECCLWQVKQELWANRKGQLNAWQQLCILTCVKKWFKHFWTIITPETHELAQISL